MPDITVSTDVVVPDDDTDRIPLLVFSPDPPHPPPADHQSSHSVGDVLRNLNFVGEYRTTVLHYIDLLEKVATIAPSIEDATDTC